MQTSSISKIQQIIKKQQSNYNGYLQQDIIYTPCHCLHCINNTQPLKDPDPLTFYHPNEKSFNSIQAYHYILSLLISFKGKTYVPDTLSTLQSQLFFSTETGRIKVKDKQSNIDVIKHFQQKRKKISIKYFSKQINTSIYSKQEKSYQKQVALLHFKDSASQILNQMQLSKSLNRRKTDKQWLDTAYIMLLPPSKKNPIQYNIYHYRATSKNRNQLLAVMQKLAAEIDYQDEKSNLKNLNDLNINNASIMSMGNISKSMNLNTFNANNSINFLTVNQTMNNNNMSLSLPSYSMNSAIFPKKRILQPSYPQQQYIKMVVYQLVAYIQITSKIRIHNAIFSYLIDPEDKCYLMKIQNLITHELQKKQQQMIHDRYKPLQHINQNQLLVLKDSLQSNQQDFLWKICAKNVGSCLDKRRVELQIEDYKRPNQQNLRKIFSKIIPEFNPKQFLSNINWQNQLPSFLRVARQKINRVIRQDQGIRILRRFNLQFYRTFD